MKILIIADNIFTLGGVQRVVTVLSNQLAKSHKVEIVCTSKGVIEAREMYGLENSIKVIKSNKMGQTSLFNRLLKKILKLCTYKSGRDSVLYNINILSMIYVPLSSKRKYAKLINENQYDVVIATEGKHSLVLGAIVNKIKAKTIGWQHSSYEAYLETPGKYYFNQHTLFRKYMDNLDKVVVLTENDKIKYRRELSIEAHVQYNPVAFSTDKKADLNNKIILFVGRLNIMLKGIDMLLEAFTEVLRHHPECKLRIVGDGEDRDKISKLIDEHGIADNVTLVGATSNVLEEYLAASVLVSTSRWEGFGLTIIEAMESGLPVVAYENTGPSEIIRTNEGGVLVKKGDTQVLAKAVTEILSDDCRRKILGKKAIARADDFSVDKIAKEWEIIINE